MRTIPSEQPSVRHHPPAAAPSAFCPASWSDGIPHQPVPVVLPPPVCPDSSAGEPRPAVESSSVPPGLSRPAGSCHLRALFGSCFCPWPARRPRGGGRPRPHHFWRAAYRLSKVVGSYDEGESRGRSGAEEATVMPRWRTAVPEQVGRVAAEEDPPLPSFVRLLLPVVPPGRPIISCHLLVVMLRRPPSVMLRYLTPAGSRGRPLVGLRPAAPPTASVKRRGVGSCDEGGSRDLGRRRHGDTE